MADAGYLTIGKVVKRLSAQYPDLSVSKVRYLEDEGLLTPSRTPGGYRLYSARDVKRLERILYLQKNRFMPLSVIREELDGGQEHDASGVSAGQAQATAQAAGQLEEALHVDAASVSELHDVDRIPEMLGVSIAFVRQLSEVGILSLVRSPHGRFLVDGRDLRLIRACDALRRFGIEPRNLRQYVTAANRESPMFEQALVAFKHGGAKDEVEPRERFDQAFEQMLGLTNVVRGSLLRRSLRASFPDGAASHGSGEA